MVMFTKLFGFFYGLGQFVGGEIHTLGIDNHDSWREVNIEERFCKAIAPGVMNQQLEHKGIIDWLAKGGRPRSGILLFDVHDEKFQTIPLPADDDEFSTTEACLRTYKLCFVERICCFVQVLPLDMLLW